MKLLNKVGVVVAFLAGAGIVWLVAEEMRNSLYVYIGVLFLATVMYLVNRLDGMNERLMDVQVSLDGLRQYLYQIDPQFDDERAWDTEGDLTDFIGLTKVQKEKSEKGLRTLRTRFTGEEI
jgi:hypothetical protein